MKHINVIAVLIILFTLLLAGCASQDEYNQLLRDFNEAQSQIEEMKGEYKRLTEDYVSLRSEADALKAQCETATAEFATVKSQVEALQTDLTASQNQRDELLGKVDRAKILVELVNSMFVPSLTGEIEQMPEEEMAALFLKWNDLVNASGDEMLKEKFQGYSLSDEQNMDFFIYLFSSLTSALE